MSRRKKSKPKQRPRRDAGASEWIGATVRSPFFVTGSPEPYRAEVALWVESPSGLILAQQLYAPGEGDGILGALLEQTVRELAAGPPRQPMRIRIADPTRLPEIRAVVGERALVSIAPTPEIDAIMADMAAWLPPPAKDGLADENGWERPSYLQEGRIPADSVALLFEVARRLHEIAPWRHADDSQLLRLDVPDLGVEGACVSIIGALGQSTGLLIFPSLDHFDAFYEVAVSEPHPTRPTDLGTSWLALEFEPADALPAPMRREVARHGWPVASKDAWPVLEHFDSDGLVRPLTERDLLLAAACAVAVTGLTLRHPDLLEQDEPEPVSETWTCEGLPDARLTLPYEAHDLFEDETCELPVRVALAAAGPRVGRNDPCPCGSGKKYKKCHLQADQAQQQPASKSSSKSSSKKDELQRLDVRLVHEMTEHVERRFPQAWEDLLDLFDDPEATSELVLGWGLHHFPIEGRPVRDWLRLDGKRRQTASERAFMEAQDAAWLSIWEVVDIRRGSGVTLEDQLTGVVCQVSDRSVSQSVTLRSNLLGRVLEHEGTAIFSGLHPRMLDPTRAAEIVRKARARLRRKRAVPPERLREYEIGRYLIRRWEEEVLERDIESRIPLVLQNTDGDPLLLTADRFEVIAGAAAQVAAQIAELEGVDELETARGELARYAFVREGGSTPAGPSGTIVGHASLSERKLRLETNSVARADALRARIEAACGDLVRHRSRDHTDPTSGPVLDAPREAPAQQSTPEAEQLVRDYKERHYRDWADQSLPALAGKTPRDAVRTPAGRTDVDLLLREMEHMEQQAPEAARFDFTRLRKQLGLL